MDVSGKKIVVTGGTSGYGRGIAKVFEHAGADVWITGRNEEKLRTVARDLRVKAIQADVSQASDWDKVISDVGDIDILVNNAGYGGRICPVSEQNDEDIAATININLTGVIMGCARAAKIMSAKKSGMIINISSICALYAWPSWSVYTAAKAGLAKFSHGLYTELRPFGVRVMCVTPSWGQTDFNITASVPAFSPDIVDKCIAPDELGKLILDMVKLPDHLAVPDVTIQPMVQDISPM